MTLEEEDRIVSRLRVEVAAIHLGDDRVVSEPEAASLLGVHPKTLASMRRSGEVPAGYLGRSPRYSLGVIRRMMREIAGGATK